MTFLTWLFGSKMNSVSLSLQENQKEIFVVKKKWEISNENKTFGKCVFATDCSSSVQSPSLVRLFVTPWTAARQASLSITNSWSLLNSCPSNQWCHTAISSSVIRFSSFLQSFPASGSSLMSQFFTLGGQSIGVSASASVLPVNIQDWFPLGWTGWISLQSKGLSRLFSNNTVQKHQFFGTQLSLCKSNSYTHTWLLEKS